VSITQVQLAAAMNTIANGGTYVAPRLLSATIDADGTARDAPASETHRAISEQAAADMTDALHGVVCDKDGTVGSHRDKYMPLPAYTVAGKTGTAYKAQNKGYLVGYDQRTGKKKIDNYKDELGQNHYMASFAGFLPVENPRLTIAVTIDEPTGEFRFGASGAAPLFAKIGAEAMRLLSVPPSPGGNGCTPASP
jgi:cell division protein FtsI/penicillin-binding protein 2